MNARKGSVCSARISTEPPRNCVDRAPHFHFLYGPGAVGGRATTRIYGKWGEIAVRREWEGGDSVKSRGGGTPVHVLARKVVFFFFSFLSEIILLLYLRRCVGGGRRKAT